MTGKIWNSVDELASVLQKAYSVTEIVKLKQKYMQQLEQYPLYEGWFRRIEQIVDEEKKPGSVIEYGPGPGLLAEILARNSNVSELICVEPDRAFFDMTNERIKRYNAKTVLSTAEEFSNPDFADVIINVATYHHLDDKPLALGNMHGNLKEDGKLIIADVFVPDYDFDENYQPKERIQFTEGKLLNGAAQILGMPNSGLDEIVDQIKTTLLEVIGIEEMKVCIPVLRRHLEEAGFNNITIELMKGENKLLDYGAYGWYFITAQKIK